MTDCQMTGSGGLRLCLAFLLLGIAQRLKRCTCLAKHTLYFDSRRPSPRLLVPKLCLGTHLSAKLCFAPAEVERRQGESKPSALLDMFRVTNEEEIALEPRGPAVCIALVPDTRGNRVGKPGLALSGCVTAKTSAFPNRVWARGGNWPAHAKQIPSY